MERILLIACGFFSFTLGILQMDQAENLGIPQKIAQRTLIPRDYNITIQGDFSTDKGVTWLNPRQLRIGRGDKVAWINESENEVKLKFGKGTQCREISLKALAWNLEPEKCYEARDTLKFKERTTIRFKDVGLYHYEVEFIGKNRKEQGMIHVQTED